MGRISKVQGVKEVRFRPHLCKFLYSILALGFLNACASTYETREVNYTPVSIERPSTNFAESDLLGVRIVSFDPGKLPKSEDQSRGISKEIRKAEAYYFAIQLKNTMQRSGYWGPVRVVPTGDSGGEVVVTGRILESDGEVLRLSIKVGDARGTHWFTKKYECRAAEPRRPHRLPCRPGPSAAGTLDSFAPGRPVRLRSGREVHWSPAACRRFRCRS